MVFEQSLDSILTDYIKTPEQDASFEEPDIVTTSVSLGFLYPINTISDTSIPWLAPSIKSCNLCQARALLWLCLWQERCQHLN